MKSNVWNIISGVKDIYTTTTKYNWKTSLKLKKWKKNCLKINMLTSEGDGRSKKITFKSFPKFFIFEEAKNVDYH